MDYLSSLVAFPYLRLPYLGGREKERASDWMPVSGHATCCNISRATWARKLHGWRAPTGKWGSRYITRTICITASDFSAGKKDGSDISSRF